jgi:hypothetical protein
VEQSRKANEEGHHDERKRHGAKRPSASHDAALTTHDIVTLCDLRRSH